MAVVRTWKDCFESVWRTPGRSSVAILVLGVGFASLLMLLAAREGVAEKEADLLRDFGAASLSWRASADDPFHERQLQTLRAAFPSWQFWGKRIDKVPHSLGAPFTEVWAVDPLWFEDRREWVSRGRFFDRAEHGARVAVAGVGLISKETPLPYILQVIPHPLTVIGVSSLVPSDAVAVPRSSSALWSGSPVDAQVEVHEIRVMIPDGLSPNTAVKRLSQEAPLLGISPSARLVSPDDVLRPLAAWRRRVTWIFGSIVAAALGLGAVGIGGIFALSVRERFPEIGLRRALGATPVQIAMVFLNEALLLVAFSMVIFGPLVWFGLRHAGTQIDWTWKLEPGLFGFAFLGVLGTALCAAALPARLAASLSPAQVLRNE